MPKIKTEVKQKIEKFYHFSSEAPISIHSISNDLKRASSDPEKLPDMLTPELISELGKLIRETIENNISPEATFIETKEEKVNIKVLCDIFETIQISLSYWEALMVIE